MKLAVTKELLPGERRVSIVPTTVPALNKLGIEVVVEQGAGVEAGYADAAYAAQGASIVGNRDEAFSADIVAQVRCGAANGSFAQVDSGRMRPGQIVIAMCDPLGGAQSISNLASSGVRLFSLELIPRITRAQSMDVLSSQAMIAGYRAVLIAAMELPKIFPMMMTAAGTLLAARVFVVGVGVAGLQAIATSRKLGGVVSAYDVRPACREQVESLGGKFIELKLDNAAAEDKGGYAKAMDDSFYQKQRELMKSVVGQSDVVITTAAIPGKRSPLLVTADAVRAMAPGSVIVDLAAERGGNCELSQPNQRVVDQGVTILGPTNLPSEVPQHASLMYSNNVAKFLQNFIKKGEIQWNLEDEILRETLVANEGKVVHARLLQELAPPSETV